MVVVICAFLIVQITASLHEALDCLSFLENDDYLGAEEGEYY